jgi:molecular chaperone GrpE (heat shock protein)
MKELKEKLMSELKDYGHRELTSNSLDIIDKLAHALKNIMRIEEYCGTDYEKSGHEVIDELETVLEKLKAM